MEEAGGAHPEVCVMAGGWRRFRRELKEDDYDLVRAWRGWGAVRCVCGVVCGVAGLWP